MQEKNYSHVAYVIMFLLESNELGLHIPTIPSSLENDHWKKHRFIFERVKVYYDLQDLSLISFTINVLPFFKIELGKRASQLEHKPFGTKISYDMDRIPTELQNLKVPQEHGLSKQQKVEIQKENAALYEKHYGNKGPVSTGSREIID